MHLHLLEITDQVLCDKGLVNQREGIIVHIGIHLVLMCSHLSVVTCIGDRGPLVHLRPGAGRAWTPIESAPDSCRGHGTRGGVEIAKDDCRSVYVPFVYLQQEVVEKVAKGSRLRIPPDG